MVVVLENRSYDAVIGSAGAPYINQLATEHGIATAILKVAEIEADGNVLRIGLTDKTLGLGFVLDVCIGVRMEDEAKSES